MSETIICNGGFEVEVWLTQRGAMFCVYMCDGSNSLDWRVTVRGWGSLQSNQLGDGKMMVEYVCITPWPNQFHLSTTWKIQVLALRIPGFQISCHRVRGALDCFATISVFLFPYLLLGVY